MITYSTAVILGYSVALPAVLGLIRYRNTLQSYQPFFIIMWLGLLNHSTSVLLNATIRSNAVNSNIYVLLETLLYLLLFYCWGAFKKRTGIYWSLSVAVLCLWITDNLLWHTLTTTNSFFRIIASFILIFLSISQFNELIVSARKNLLLNARFLICTGIIIYFSYKATIEVFFFIRLKASDHFYTSIFIILIFVNLFVNLLFAWASLWVPKKQGSISQR